MSEVIPFSAAAKSSPSPPKRSAQQLPYETYAAYLRAESAFRALYLGRPLDTETLTHRQSAEIVQQHWATVQQLAETLLREKSLRREHVLKLLLHASLDAATTAGA